MGDYSHKNATIKSDFKIDNTTNDPMIKEEDTRVLEMPSLGLAGMELDNHISTLSNPRENGPKRLIVINRKVVK